MSSTPARRSRSRLKSYLAPSIVVLFNMIVVFLAQVHQCSHCLSRSLARSLMLNHEQIKHSIDYVVLYSRKEHKTINQRSAKITIDDCSFIFLLLSRQHGKYRLTIRFTLLSFVRMFVRSPFLLLVSSRSLTFDILMNHKLSEFQQQ
jgi:hypothetical protein